MADHSDSQNAVNAVFRLINAGQFEQAESVCRAHLSKEADDVNILGLLGAILLKLGNTDDASVWEKAVMASFGLHKRPPALAYALSSA